MWKTSEKYALLGLGYSIWACVLPGASLGAVITTIVLSLIGVCYFCASVYQSFKEE